MLTSIFRRVNTKEGNSVLTGLLYGLINGVMLIPITISFCTIIYQDKGFEKYLPQLVKLVMFSSMIHQWAFTYFSSLPFAIGQVQDAGLIFLSAMAADIVSNCAHEDQIVPTAIVVLPICTFLLGIMLVIVAKLRLATVIQYLPMPVIGGYLAYIGFFCGQAGLAMMAGVQVTNITEWGNFYSEHAVILLTPGVILGITTYLLLCNVRSPYVLPGCMIGIVSIFFGCMYLSGMTLEEARDYGWVAPLATPEPFYHSWALYNFSLVDWNMLPQQILRLISMFLVVAFSSSLDVAAIEMEMGLPLDYNRELNTVGLANIFSGLTGGYTGSYIFSQTIFTMRRGVYSRINGYTVVLCEALLILTPISVISYLPKMFFGSLLVMISSDLMTEWLFAARHKMAVMEYVVCLLTFVAIQGTGIEIGMFIGILLAMMSFVVSYSSLQSVSCASLQTSTVIRTFEERAALIAHRGRVVTITLKGYIFFGSAVKILEDVKSHVSISVPELSPQQLMELQLAQKSESSAKTEDHTSSTDAPTETSALLPRQAASGVGSYQSNGAALPLDPAQEFKQLDRSIFSFQRSSSQKSKTPSQAGSSKGSSYDTKERDHIQDAIGGGGSNGVTTTGSAAKKLFPDISIPLSPVGVVNSDISPSVVAAAASQGLSVYDMSPEMLQHIIEEKNRDLGGDNNYVGSFTSRENTSGFNNAKQQPLGRKLYPSANAAHLPPVAPKAKSFQATSSVHAGQAPSSSQLEGDLEMGVPQKSTVSPTGKSLLTEGIKNGETTELALARSVDSSRQHPFRRQSGSKIPSAPAPATTTAALDILWTQDTSRANSNNSADSGNFPAAGRPAGAQRHVSFDGDLPGNSDIASSLPTRASSESVLATIWEQQSHRRKRANSIQSADINSNSNNNPSESAPKLTMTESLEILRLPSRDSSASAEDFHQASSPLSFTPPSQRPAEFGMTRERSFQEEYKSTKARRKAGESIHIPATPPPEMVLQSLAREHKQREEKQAEQSGRQPEAEIMTEYLVLDFTAVVGVDATATRSCFLMLVQLMRSAHVTVVFANMRSHLEALFRAHRVIGAQDIVIPLLDDALEWCEEQVLSKAGLHVRTHQKDAPASAPTTPSGPLLERNASFYSRAGQQRQQMVKSRQRTFSNSSESDLVAFASHHNTPPRVNGLVVPSGSVVSAAALRHILEDYLEVDSGSNPQLRRLLRSELLVKYFHRVTFAAREILFDVNQLADRIYFIEGGEVEIVTVGPSELEDAGSHGIPFRSDESAGSGNGRDENLVVVRVNKVSAGGAFGEADFLLGKNHSVQAYTMSECVFWTLNRENYARMELHEPSLCLLIQHSLLKSLAIASTCALYAQHPTAAYTNNAAL